VYSQIAIAVLRLRHLIAHGKVDGSPHLASEARFEVLGGLREARPAGKGQLHLSLSALPTAIVLDSRLLSRLRRPVRRFNTELLGVLRVKPLPVELHRLTTNDTADGSSVQKPIQNIETNVPPGGTH
jgi:hypothetical protein